MIFDVFLPQKWYKKIALYFRKGFKTFTDYGIVENYFINRLVDLSSQS